MTPTEKAFAHKVIDWVEEQGFVILTKKEHQRLLKIERDVALEDIGLFDKRG